MMDEEMIRGRVERINDLPEDVARLHFMGLYRDLVISIGDGDIVGDPRRLCRIVTAAELRQGVGV